MTTGKLIGVADGAEFFRSADGRAHATVQVKAHFEHWPVRGKQFFEWLQRRHYENTGELARQQDLREATKAIEARTLFDAPELPVFIRVGDHARRSYLDLANDEWQVVEIDEQGWRVVTAPSVKFLRTPGVQPLPVPVSGGSIGELRPFLNVAGQSDWSLLVAYVVSALHAVGPFPILSLFGEQGTAKSTVARVIRAIVDPRSSGLRAQPRHVHDLMIAAQNSWVLSFDNLSFIPAWFSDALCRLATGGGFATRQLHTDSQETLFDAERPVILTGIGELATRSDLLDRCINIELPRIAVSQRRSEDEFWRELNAALPRILGAFLSAVSRAVKNLPSTHVSNSPRMADFAIWVSAAEPALGWEPGTFLSAYDENRAAANQIALEASPIAAPLFKLLAKGPWQGTATALLNTLAQNVDPEAKTKIVWPQTESALSVGLRRLAPNLRSAGIELSFGRQTDRTRTRTISLRFLPSAPSAASAGTGTGESVQCGMQKCATPESPRNALLEQAHKELLDILPRAKSGGDFKAAVAAVRGIISIARLTPDGGGVLEEFYRELQDFSDEELNATERVATGNAEAVGTSGETAPGKDQQST